MLSLTPKRSLWFNFPTIGRLLVWYLSVEVILEWKVPKDQAAWCLHVVFKEFPEIFWEDRWTGTLFLTSACWYVTFLEHSCFTIGSATRSRSEEERETLKRQSKVESYSIEWSVYWSMQSRPVGISSLMPHALHFWPSLIRVYVSSRDAHAAWNQALEHVHFFRKCCGNNRDNYNLISVHAPLIAMVFMTSKCIISHLVLAWNLLPLQF